MKKMIAVLIALTMSLPLAACGNSAQSSVSAELPSQQSAPAQIAENSPPESSSASQSNISQENSVQKPSSSQSAESTPADNSSSPVSESSGTEALEATTGKILVAYFSRFGNTRAVATGIQTSVGADIFEIKTTYEYPAGYDDALVVAQKEQDDHARPELCVDSRSWLVS